MDIDVKIDFKKQETEEDSIKKQLNAVQNSKIFFSKIGGNEA
jgi:hypothetical protein